MAPPRSPHRRPHRNARGPALAFTIAAALTTAVVTPLIGPSTPPPATDTAPPARLLSRYETAAPGNHINRDCGYSAPLPARPGHTLWLFCDSLWSGTHRGLTFGATAATGPYRPGRVPTGLTELPPPPQAPPENPGDHPPQGMLRTPPGLQLPATAPAVPAAPGHLAAPSPTAPCHIPGTAYSASWISGAAHRPGTTALLLTYTDVCVRGNTISTQGFGLVEYRPATNALGAQARVFTATAGLPFQHNLGSPVFAGGHLYLYAAICDHQILGTCQNGRVTLARVPADPATWTDPAAYRYRTANGWTPDAFQAHSVLPGAAPTGVHVADYTALGKGYALIEQHGVNGDFRVWHAPTPAGPWKPARRGTAPCGGQSGVDLCRAYIGHPELSTPRHLLMSHYNPADDHISVTAVPW
ncbi:hypothetical protein [Spirillospora sp. NPDC029432]|uniref:hypothetical protein n=1 Tax=Spirillospora sp. NPDC029432 TaxID=3154599 RepID=UPI0034523ABF